MPIIFECLLLSETGECFPYAISFKPHQILQDTYCSPHLRGGN